MQDSKSYNVGKSAYAFVPVSEGNVLAPVWLQPDPTDQAKAAEIHCHEKQRHRRLGPEPHMMADTRVLLSHKHGFY